MTIPEFTVDKVAWHSQTPGNPETPEQIHRRFRTIVSFLQDHGLTERTLLAPEDELTDGFEIRTSDLTSEGLLLLKNCYDKWLKKIDKGMDPGDIRLLRRSLQAIREAAS
jgi:hypothetical protein